MKKWVVSMKKADFTEWSRKHDISPIIARLIRNRGLEENEVQSYLKGTIKDCLSPYLLKDIKKAVLIITEKKKEQKKIRIIGDYDADGICSTFILQRGLELIGAKVDAVIPHRIEDGYGLNQKLVDQAFEQGIDTIITCDNGISAISQIERAKQLGMTVIITDHHEPFFEIKGEKKEEQLPMADAIIDCKQEACDYPFKNICGAVTALKLIQALCETYEIKNQRLFDDLIQAAAIATVCDIMELKEENRYIVKEGLNQMRKNPLVGLKALCKANNIEIEKVASYHLGFVIGPNLNASGRLDSALRGFALLNESNEDQAEIEALKLKALNDERKELTEQGIEQAISQIKKENQAHQKVLVVYLQDCHESIAGIIAGKVKEIYHKPVLILTDAKAGLKGSGRSIEHYDLHHALVECDDLLSKYGGHKMAAGFSLPTENLEKFKKRLNDNCKLTEEDFIEKLEIDMQLPFEYATLELVHEIQKLEPFGVGNRKPLFGEKDVKLAGVQKIGKEKKFLKIWVEDYFGHKYDLMLFQNGELFLHFLENTYSREEVSQIMAKKGQVQFKCAYQISSNWYQNKEKIQFLLVDYC